MNNEKGKMTLAEKAREKAGKMNTILKQSNISENEIVNWCYESIIKDVDKVAGYGCHYLSL